MFAIISLYASIILFVLNITSLGSLEAFFLFIILSLLVAVVCRCVLSFIPFSLTSLRLFRYVNISSVLFLFTSCVNHLILSLCFDMRVVIDVFRFYFSLATRRICFNFISFVPLSFHCCYSFYAAYVLYVFFSFLASSVTCCLCYCYSLHM